jgi:hypothetical protein
MSKFIVLIPLAFSISACGLALQSQKDEAIGRCHAQYPTFERSTAVARVKCENSAFDLMRPALGNDDLFVLHHTSAVVIAERYQNGQLTEAEAQQQLAALRSQIINEADRRDSNNQAARAASSAALIHLPTFSEACRAKRGTIRRCLLLPRFAPVGLCECIL